MRKYLVPLFFALLSCGEHSFEDLVEDFFETGFEPSNIAVIPQDIKSFSDTSNLPPSVSLEDKFPPVQSQGRYGTCVAWGVGYALKTALNAIDKNWSVSDLAKPSNQTSPKDLWLAISLDDKGNNCGGTASEYAMNALIANGAASMAEVPYDMSDGSCNASSSAAKGNPNNKLANYRKIAYNYTAYGGSKNSPSVETLKSYLAQGRPLNFGGRVRDRFMKWNSSAVLSSDYGNPGGHEMALVGYDDSKRAFRVRNSWGESWGDKGSIWIDYDYFISEDFFLDAFVAQNPNSSPDKPPDNPPAPGSYDLLTSFAEDYPDPEDKTGNPRARAFSYEIYNKGAQEILASQRWGVYYLYYNAYNAYEFGIIFEDYYTDERGQPCAKPEDFDNEVCWGKYENTFAIAGGIWNNMNVKPGKRAGEAEAGDGYVFEMPYTMPSINGDYYLVVYADQKDVIKESNEDNNMYFISDKDGKPLKFIDGVMQTTPANSSVVLGKRPRPAPVHSVVDLGELNAYTPQEIKTLLNRDKKSGTLAKKIAEYRESAHPVKRIRRQR